jgi:hypothetical protein
VIVRERASESHDDDECERDEHDARRDERTMGGFMGERAVMTRFARARDWGKLFFASVKIFSRGCAKGRCERAQRSEK